MATTTPSIIASGAVCLPVRVLVQNSFWSADPLWLGLGFLLGFIFGAIVAIVCVKICIKDIAKKRYQDEEEAMMGGVPAHKRNRRLSETQNEDTEEKGKKKKRSLRRKGKKKGDEDEPLITMATVGEGTEDNDSIDGSRGLGDALIQANNDGIDAELATQDLDSFLNFEKDLKEEEVMSFIQLMRILLGRMLMKGAITEPYYKDFMKKMQENIRNIRQTCLQEKKDAEEELRNDPKLSKNEEALQREIEKLHPIYVRRMTSLLKEEKERLRQELEKHSGLDEKQIDAIMWEHDRNMAELDRKLGEEGARQAASLDERLARRRALAEMYVTKKTNEHEEMELKKRAFDSGLSKLVEDGKLLDRQKDDLLNTYEQDCRRLQRQHEEELQRQQLQLAEKLRQKREMRMTNSQDKQQKERENFLKKAEKIVKAGEFTEMYHDLLQQQRLEKEDLEEDLDQEELQELTNLRKDLEKQRAEQLSRQDEQLQDSLQTKAQLSERDAERIIKIHQQEMDEFNRSKQREKKRMNQMLQEKIAQRRQKVDDENMRTGAEQQAMKAEQETTIKKLLDTQMDLDDKAKEKILKEHEENMQKVNNQLNMSRLRQQKMMEQKLGKRRTKVSELKDQKEKADGKDKEKLDKQIEEEEQKLQEDRANAIVELRKRLSEETEEALKDQEKEIGILVAKFEVGSARRQAILQKQDKSMKELEDQLANHMEESGPRVDGHVDQLLQQHYGQVSNIEEQLQDQRRRQEQMLMEKIQQKKMRKEREVQTNLERDAQDQWEQQQKRGAGLATSILSQAMLEQRHKRAMDELEQDMQKEMQQQREELNREMDTAMQQELEDQKKVFLGQLAAVSKMSKEDVDNLVQNAVADTGGDEKQAKKLSKEMRMELKRAKTELDLDDNPARGGHRNYDNDAYDDEEDDDYRGKRNVKRRGR